MVNSSSASCTVGMRLSHFGSYAHHAGIRIQFFFFSLSILIVETSWHAQNLSNGLM